MIVKGSNADSGVIFNPPIINAVFKNIQGNILIFLRENKEAIISAILNRHLSFSTRSINFEVSIFNCQIRITVLNYTVTINK